MDWSQPVLIAAAVSGGVSLVVGILTVGVNAVVTTWVSSRKITADREQAMSDKAWADYELRRDIYLDAAKQIDCLFESGKPEERREFLRTARRVRVVGSDAVVTAMNALLDSIRNGGGEEVSERLFRSFFNEIRRDIRQLHRLPPQGTELGEDAFPIEGPGA